MHPADVPARSPAPTPEPVEVVLVDAEPTLVLLAANDGSTDAYLVPGYRFTDADGGRVDLPAVADESLTTPPTTEPSVPETPILPDPGGKPPVDPQPCGPPLVEEDASGTTHTVQPDPDCVDPELAIGVGYYVDVVPSALQLDQRRARRPVVVGRRHPDRRRSRSGASRPRAAPSPCSTRATRSSSAMPSAPRSRPWSRTPARGTSTASVRLRIGVVNRRR